MIHPVKRVSIADNYARKSVDIDGDLVPDISHGDLIERCIRAKNPGVVFDRFDLVDDRKTTGSQETYLKQLRGFAAETRKKAGEVDAVCLMQGIEWHFPSLYSRPDGKPVFTRENLADFRDRFRQVLPTDWLLGKPIGRLINSLERLARKVPVYIAAGNQGPESLNLMLLARHVRGIGASQPGGAPEYFSPDHTLVSGYEQGIRGVYKVAGGFDFTGDHRPDVMDSEVSGGRAFVSYLVGQSAAKATLSDAAFEQQRAALGEDERFRGPEDQLMTFRQLAAIGEVPASMADRPELAYRPGTSRILYLFGVNPDGTLFYDPDGSGRRDARTQIRGTSVAGAMALARDLAQDTSPGRRLRKAG